MDALDILDSGAAALLFAATFLAGDRLHPLRRFTRDPRSLVSFAAGLSAAYVFVDLLPTLSVARETLERTAPAELPLAGLSLYVIALVGFTVFYGLDHLRSKKHVEKRRFAYRVHLGGFVLYALLTSYLLVRGLGETEISRSLYAIAMAAHLVTIDHSLHELSPPGEARIGRSWLAAACMLGWGLALLVPVPAFVLALALGFLAGSVIVNSAVSELPQEREGRFGPFVLGALLYALVLIPL